MRPTRALPVLVTLALLCGCLGAIGANGSDEQARAAAPTGTDPPAVGMTGPAGMTGLPGGLRRLSRAEYALTVRDLLGAEARPAVERLPEDVISADDAFDNDASTQQPDAALIGAVESLAMEVATRVTRDPARRGALVPCTPRGPADTACLEAFITRFGRRALRRPLATDEVQRLLGLHKLAAGDFFVGIELVLRALLQHPEFLYRVERGAPVAGSPGLSRLGPFETATRLSYFLVGSTPDDALLDEATAGRLTTTAELRRAGERLLGDRRARDLMHRFHGLWLSYDELPHAPELSLELQAETRALVERVVFDRPGRYQDLFTADETFVSDRLARHYGLPSPGAKPAWVPYGASGRRGILSHGSVLSAYAKPADTSPTLRGRFVSTRLLCREIPEPPPEVDPNASPKTTSPCRREQQLSRTSGGVCQACHSLMDPIGFGLEAYDREGRFRTHETDQPGCPIDGQGEVAGAGAFRGPAGLAELLVGGDRLEECVVRHAYRFATGHHDGQQDAPVVAALAAGFRQRPQLRELFLALVTHPAFVLRRDDEERKN